MIDTDQGPLPEWPDEDKVVPITGKQIDTEALKRSVSIQRVVEGFLSLKKSGADAMVGLCPFHRETTPSFTVHPVAGYFFCFGCQATGDVIDFVSQREGIDKGKSFKALCERVADLGGASIPYQSHQPDTWRVVATYDYQDESGAVLYQVRRVEPGKHGAKKDFPQYRPDADGGWILGLGDVRRVLWRLPSVVAADTVYIAEGEKCALALVAMGLCGTTISGGATGKLPTDVATTLAGKTVIILPDQDEPGKQHGLRLLAAIRATAKRCVIVHVPEPHNDVADWTPTRAQLDALVSEQLTTIEDLIKTAVATGDPRNALLLGPKLALLDAEQLTLAINDLSCGFGKILKVSLLNASIKAAREKLRYSAKPRKEESLLKVIDITNRQMRELSEEALTEFRAGNDPEVDFVRSGQLVYVLHDEKGRPTIAASDEHRIRGRLARTANFMRCGKDSDTNVPPPMDTVRDIMHACGPEEWQLPSLTSVVEVPTLRPDGSVLDTPGYDAAASCYYSPVDGMTVPPIPDAPNADDVDAARTTLDDAIGDFPFCDDASKANLIALMLTPILRPAFVGPTPLAVIDAPAAGTGKTLLVKVVSLVTTGRDGSMSPYPRQEEEMAKAIGAFLLAARPMVIFDNVDGALGSPNLALVITATDYEARMLGYSKNLNVPNLATWIATGNNIRPAGDMPRRCYQIRLDAKMSNPHQERAVKYAHDDLLGWVSANRGKLLHALLVIARAWFAAKMPPCARKPMGSFEAWSRMVGGILQYAGIAGFLGNFEEFIESEDESAAQWCSFLSHIYSWHGEEIFKISKLADYITSNITTVKHYLPDAIDASIAKGGLVRSLGYHFRAKRDLRVGRNQIYAERYGDSGTGVWRVMETK